MEQRHDWSKFIFTMELFKYVFCNLIPDVIRHTEEQDTEQVRDHYDRTCPPHCSAWLILIRVNLQEATTFTNGSLDLPVAIPIRAFLTATDRFLGPRMIYTSGIINDLEREETLEELQDNKLTVVCEKVSFLQSPACRLPANQYH